MAYYIGDIPAEDVVIEPARNDEPIDLTPFTAADTEVVLRDFDGTVVDTSGFVASFDDEGQIDLEWPDESVFAAEGLYSLTVTLVGGVARERLAPVYLVCQDDNGWHTLDTARAEWDNAPSDDARLWSILWAAKQQVTAFAPGLVDDAPVPANYRLGQLMQARNLWNAGKVDPSTGGLGDDTFVIRPFPLDWMVKQVLRPRPGIPAVG